MKFRYAILATLVVVCITLFVAPSVQGQNAVTGCLVSAADASAFPQIALRFRATDLSNRVVDLDASHVSVNESSLVIPTVSSFNKVENGVGLNIYFVVDQGRNTDQEMARYVIRGFADQHMKDGDTVTLISSDDSQGDTHLTLIKTQSKNELASAVTQMPLTVGYMRSALSATQTALAQIASENVGCRQYTAVVVLTGQDSSFKGIGDRESYIMSEASKLGTPVHFIHIGKNNYFPDEESYRQVASGAGGLYFKLQKSDKQTQDYDAISQQLFSSWEKERRLYLVEYRSASGKNGERSVDLLVDGQTNVLSSSSYSVTLLDPEIEIVSPAEGSTVEYSPDGDSAYPVQLTVTWGDGFPRYLVDAAVTVSFGDGDTEKETIVVGESSNEFRYDLPLSMVAGKGETPVLLEVNVTDELGRSGRDSSTFTLLPSGAGGIVKGDGMPTWAKVALTVIAVVVVFGVTFIVLRYNQIAIAASESENVGEFVGNIRRTMVGDQGDKSGPASIKIMDGPSDMIGKEISLSKSPVRLGRNSDISDISFYGVTVSSSVSGHHVDIYKNDDGLWCVKPVSSGGTFIDNSQIAQGGVYPLQDKQVVRMGYPGQKCIVFQFFVSSNKELSRKAIQTDIGEHAGDLPTKPAAVVSALQANGKRAELSRPSLQTELTDDPTGVDDEEELDGFLRKYRERD